MMYRKEPSVEVLAGKPLTWTISLPLMVMTLLLVLLGFVPGLMDWLTIPAGARLLEMFGY
jgi:hypothetical protein